MQSEVAKLCKELEAETQARLDKLSRVKEYECNRASRDAGYFLIRVKQVLRYCDELTGAPGTVRDLRETWHDTVLRESRRYFAEWDCLIETECDDAETAEL